MVAKRKIVLTGLTDVPEAMRTCRKAIARVQLAYPSNTAKYREATVLLADIDSLALLITGDREYFWDKPHKADSDTLPKKRDR